MNGLSNLIDRQIGHALRQAGATLERLGTGFSARLAISLVGLGGIIPASGGAIAAAAREVIRPNPRLVRLRLVRVGSHVQVVTVVMVPEAKMKWS
jgi:hypothetical protein